MTLGKRRLGESLFTLLGKLTATKENLQNYQRAYKERGRERGSGCVSALGHPK